MMRPKELKTSRSILMLMLTFSLTHTQDRPQDCSSHADSLHHSLSLTLYFGSANAVAGLDRKSVDRVANDSLLQLALKQPFHSSVCSA